jgi:hypothetical protein
MSHSSTMLYGVKGICKASRMPTSVKFFVSSFCHKIWDLLIPELLERFGDAGLYSAFQWPSKVPKG